MAVQDRTVLVLFGSETGNAQDLAEEVGKLCQRLHFKSTVEELNAVDLVCSLAMPNSCSTDADIAHIECPDTASACYLHLIDDRPRGHATQLTLVLEEIVAEKITSRLSKPPEIYHFRTR